MQDNLQQAIHYFKAEKGFDRLFPLFIDKYRSLGRVGGSVKLHNPTIQEREALSSFFRQDYKNQKVLTVSLSAFATALEQTRFTGVDFHSLLQAYQREPLQSKLEEAVEYDTSKEAFFSSFMQDYSHPYAQLWLQKISEKSEGTRSVHMMYDRDRYLLYAQLHHVLVALSRLPVKNMRLPLFASQVTGDPHAFDFDSDQGKHLLAALSSIRLQEDATYDGSTTTIEEKTETLLYFGIIRDDVLNFVTCVGLSGFREGVNEVLPLWQAALEDHAVLNIPLREVIRLSAVNSAIHYRDPQRPNIVFLVENSSVFSAILDHLDSQLPPMICTHGQFKLATLMLLDRLVATGAVLYYAGDFDPEGLQMAQRLMNRFPRQVVPWRFTSEDYFYSIKHKNHSRLLTDARLKKLDSINATELIDVKKELFNNKVSGYQEELIAFYVEDIKRIL